MPPPELANNIDPDDYPRGTDWRRFHVDPEELDVVTRHEHSSCPPWYYPRHETGSVINHGVRLNTFLFSPERFFAGLGDQKILGTEHYSRKSFLYGFPSLPKNCTKADIFEFFASACLFSMGYGVMIPPLHTYEYGNHHGSWYHAAPDHCRIHWGFYDQVLAEALKMSSTNLGDSSMLAHLITFPSGYEILWAMAFAAGHPKLTYDIEDVAIPSQRSQTSFQEYIQQWKYYLFTQYLRGIFLSDRYFIEEFIRHLNGVFNTGLKPILFSAVRDIPRNRRVPHNWTLSNLPMYVCQLARFNGTTDLLPSTTPSDFANRHKRRPASSASTRPMRALDSPAPTMDVRQTTDNSPFDIRQTDLVEDTEIFALICALSASTRTCDMCGSPDHIIAQCPKLLRLVKEPVTLKRLLFAIDKARSSGGGPTSISASLSPPAAGRPSSRPSTPTRSNRSAPLRSVLQDDDTDTDVSLNQLTDDEGADFGEAH